MSIKKDVDELQNVNVEIARLSKSLAQLRKTKKIIEQRIAEYLEKEELPAIKDRNKGVIIRLKNETKSVFELPKKERVQESISILQSVGVRDAEEILSKLKNVGKNAVEKKTVRINKFTN